MPDFKTDTGHIYYEIIEPEPKDNPAPPALTLLHNFMSTGRTAWSEAILDRLQPHYRILLPDLPGHGHSLGYPDRFDHEPIARQIAALMDAEGFTQGHLAGCSAGGMIALRMLHHNLVQPTTLALVSSTYSVNPTTTRQSLSLDPQNFRAGRNWLQFTATLHNEYQGENYFDTILLPGFRSLTPELVLDLPPETLTQWLLPVCIIHGDQDEIFPVTIAHEMARRFPNAELHIIPDQSHALIFRQPWKVAELLQDFLNRHPSPITSPET